MALQIAVSGALLVSSALAQPGPRATLVDAPGVSLAAPDDASAVDLNPSALPSLPAWNLAYSHVEGAAGTPFSLDGDALRAATPLPFGIALGVSLNHVRPEGAASARGTGSLAFGLDVGRGLSVGSSFRITGSADPAHQGRLGWDLAASWRGARTVTLAWVLRDVNAAVDIGNPGGAAVPASALMAWGLRPFGTDALHLEPSLSVNTDGDVGLRALLLARVPYVGRLYLSGDVPRIDRNADWSFTAGAFVDWGRMSAGGGVIVAKGQSSPGAVVTASLSGLPRDGVPSCKYVLSLKVESAGARGVLALLARLEDAARNPQVAGVFVRFRGTDLGTAHAQEVREAFSALRGAGKPVVCHLDAGSGSEFFACARATHTYVDPAGGVRLVGPSGTGIYLGDALAELGVHTEFVRIGEYKSAPEQFTAAGSTAAAKEARGAFYDDVREVITAGLAEDFRTTAENTTALIDRGPYIASELRDLRVVRGTADERDFAPELDGAFGGPFPLVDAPAPAYDTAWASPERIGVVVVDGDIVDGTNVDIPFLGIQSSGGETIADTLDAMAADSTIAAIVLRIDSPGGSVMASDQIWRAVMRARAKKPVVASMGAVAASGGYYIASAAHEIWADDATLTGSIGVFFGKADVAGLAKKLHVGLEEIARGKRAGLESLWRPLSLDERAMLAGKVLKWYQMFLARIEQGRKLAPSKVDPIARGRVWSGKRAKAHGLVDNLGGFLPALARARALAKAPQDAPVTFAPSRPSSLLDYLLIELGLARALSESNTPRDASAALPSGLRPFASFFAGLMRAQGGAGFARMEDVFTDAP